MSNPTPEHYAHLRNLLWELVTDNKKQRITEVLDQRTQHLTVVLEDVFQPQNISAALRSCECFGIQDAYNIGKKHPAALKHAITRGASDWMTVHNFSGEEDSLEQCLRAVKAKGYRLVGTSPHATTSLHELSLDTKTAFMFGTEREGLSEQALSMVDETIKIPMVGFTESFNISVSVALILYETTRRLRNSDVSWQLSPEERQRIELEWLRKIVPGSRELERRMIDIHPE